MIDGLVRYQVLARWARGGMADVFVARQVGKMGFDKLVALKVLRRDLVHDEALREMFMQEARTAVLLNHPRIIQTYDAEQVGESLYLVMEFVRGETLRHVMEKLAKAGEAPPTPFALELVYQIGLALDYAHQLKDLHGNPLNLVHRDVAPSNIMLTEQGGTKLLDFGIAKVTAARHSSDAGVVKGKFAYMSPEQIQGQPLDRRSDVYALGLVLWELLTGRPALVGERDVDIIRAAVRPNIPPPSAAGGPALDGLDELVLRAITPDLAGRLGTARELAEEANRLRVRLFPEFNLSAYIRELLDRYFAGRRAKLDELLANFADASDPDAFEPVVLEPEPSTQIRTAKASIAPQDSDPQEPALRLSPPPRRRKPVVAAIAVAGLLCVAAAVAWGVISRDATRDRVVVVTSDPPGASVYANGRALGRTPLDVHVRRGAPLALTFSQLGFEQVSRIVGADDARGVSVRLPRSQASGSVTVRTTPAGASVTVDGVERSGQTPLIIDGLWRGEPHRISVRLAGYEPQARAVDLSRDASAVLQVPLAPLAGLAPPSLTPTLVAAVPQVSAWAGLRSSAGRARPGAPAAPADSTPPVVGSASLGSSAPSSRIASPSTLASPSFASPSRLASPSFASPSTLAPPPFASPSTLASPPFASPSRLAPPPFVSPSGLAPPPAAAPPPLPQPVRAAPAAVALPPPRIAQPRAAPTLRLGLPRITGVVDRSAVRHSLDGLLPRFGACVLVPPTPTGQVLLRFVLDDAGRARNATSSGASVAANACLERALRGAVFPGSTAADAAIQVALDVQRP